MNEATLANHRLQPQLGYLVETMAMPLSKRIAAASGLVLLTACGGGSSSGGTDITPPPPAFTVTTLAGTALVVGSGDGTGAAASFENPSGLAVDSSGNVYVSDSLNHTIRKVTPAGVVSTLAGTPGVIGSADGAGAAASFFEPIGVAVDGAGNVYAADSFSTIRKITPGGVVTTLAGTAKSSGHDDGTGASASFYDPRGVAVDGSGNVYVADTYNMTIRKITPAGVVTTLAGSPGAMGHADGTGASASFYYPYGVAVDGSGTVYVADTYNNTVRKITPAGVVTTLAGNPNTYGHADGTGASATFASPAGLAVDGSGNVYVADTENSTVRKVTPAGIVSTVAGIPGVTGHTDGASTAATFYFPQSLAVDNSGKFVVVDTGNNIIRLMTPSH